MRLWIVGLFFLFLTLVIANLLFPPYDRLLRAILTDRPFIVRAALITGSSPDGCDYPTSNRYSEPMPPLANAVGRNKVDVVKALLNAGAQPNFLFADEATPLTIALYKSSEDVIRLLLKYGADPLARTSGGTVISETLADKKFPNKAKFLESYLDSTDPTWRTRPEHSVPKSCVYGKR